MSRDRTMANARQTMGGTAAAFALATALMMPGGAALAATSELDMAGIQPVADEQLSNMRGGFSMGGMDISFGVIMQTLINGTTSLVTSFNLDNPMNPDVAFANPTGSFVLQHAANGGFVLTNGIGTTTLQQMGNAGGGIVASIANSLNNQTIQQNTSVNIGIQNANTIMGLSAIGMLMERFTPNLVR